MVSKTGESFRAFCECLNDRISYRNMNKAKSLSRHISTCVYSNPVQKRSAYGTCYKRASSPFHSVCREASRSKGTTGDLRNTRRSNCDCEMNLVLLNGHQFELQYSRQYM
ncbi:hypothetical protein EGW08_000460 [Elysia chlorotica]|uniref:Uncharacterized protein n=1 Tax=Elysia chlorotica TaxID=188477 RepID=A0A433UDB3_ELYCH|nr:hypothetical protein EGW08_000460 [Elysia chlorotica]